MERHTGFGDGEMRGEEGKSIWVAPSQLSGHALRKVQKEPCNLHPQNLQSLGTAWRL